MACNQHTGAYIDQLKLERGLLHPVLTSPLFSSSLPRLFHCTASLCLHSSPRYVSSFAFCLCLSSHPKARNIIRFSWSGSSIYSHCNPLALQPFSSAPVISHLPVVPSLRLCIFPITSTPFLESNRISAPVVHPSGAHHSPPLLSLYTLQLTTASPYPSYIQASSSPITSRNDDQQMDLFSLRTRIPSPSIHICSCVLSSQVFLAQL